MHYWDIFINGYKGYASYLWNDIVHPGWNSYFYWLLIVSFFFFGLEIFAPWRKDQRLIRKDFWLDAFYMFFNFFLFSLIIYNAASDVIVNLFNDTIKNLSGGFNLQANNPLNEFPYWSVLLIGFIVRDFTQWWIHRLLHNNEKLWQFHKVHHSVEEMGFAAHLRFHWMENIVYRSIEYIPLALLGLGLYDFFVIHIFSLAWGHFNHSNISVNGRITGGILGALLGIILANGLLEVSLFAADTAWQKGLIIGCSILAGIVLLGPVMKYIFNSPELHIWHHAKELPRERQKGVNFALTLAIWDYLFGTAYRPYEGKDIKLGFPGIENYPSSFWKQNTSGFEFSGFNKHKNQI